MKVEPPGSTCATHFVFFLSGKRYCYIYILYINTGESGVVYKAYINKAIGTDLVAVKTGKGECKS